MAAPDPSKVLHDAANWVFCRVDPSRPKERLSHHLITHSCLLLDDGRLAGAPLPLDSAAEVAGVSVVELRQVLSADKAACFTMTLDGQGVPGVLLHAGALKEMARSNTATGTLFGELPTPAGFVEDGLPVRPGRPFCKHYSTFGKCDFKGKCVFNHASPAQLWELEQQQQQRGQPAAAVPPSGASSSTASSSNSHQFQQPMFPTAAAGVATAAPAAAHQAGPSRPGQRPCPQYMRGGVCPFGGPDCPFDHPPRQPGTGATWQQQQAFLSTPLGASGPPGFAAARQQPPPARAPAAAAAPSGPRVAAAPAAAANNNSSGSSSCNASTSNMKYVQTGVNDEGLPQFLGAPCCAFYLGTGKCDFRSGCKYHHPNRATHPLCVASGQMPKRYFPGARPPEYARLVNHVQRLWDYTSCPAAALKCLLARHLLAKHNPGCAMWDDSAASPVVPHDEREATASGGQLGPYSCSMGEAERVLTLLWKAAPDEAAAAPMPFTGRVGELLSNDPYINLRTLPSGQRWVQLRLSKIIDGLNY